MQYFMFNGKGEKKLELRFKTLDNQQRKIGIIREFSLKITDNWNFYHKLNSNH